MVIPRPFMLSTYFASPQKLGEFMAAGCCVVATDLPYHHWALKDPTCGILCPPNSKGIAQGILKAGDPQIRLSYSNIAHEKAVENFSHYRQSEKILSYLDEK